MAIACTPEGLLSEYKCLSCLSASELIAVLVVATAQLEGTYSLPEDLDTLLQDSACFSCLSDKQKLQALVSSMAQEAYTDSGVTVADVREDIKCLLCADPGHVKAALLLLLCRLIDTLTRQN